MVMKMMRACFIAFTWLAVGYAKAGQGWDTFSDTWVGDDALGRALPVGRDVGPPREGKTVGMFYFLTFEHGTEPVCDNSKILAAHPEAMKNAHDPAWGTLNASHYWGEPLFGYYASDDEYVLRKHARMLVNAGVDVVIFDNSNEVTYDKARTALCRVWEEIGAKEVRRPRSHFFVLSEMRMALVQELFKSYTRHFTSRAYTGIYGFDGMESRS